MSAAPRVFVPHNRLARLLSGGGGAGSEELVANADLRVKALSEKVSTCVDEQLDALSAVMSGSPEALWRKREQIAAAALRLAELGGAIGQERLGAIANGLVRLLEAMADRGSWRADAVHLHLAALCLVRASPAGADTTGLLERLADMRESLGVVE